MWQPCVAALSPASFTHASFTHAFPQLLVTFAEPKYATLCGRSWSVTAQAWNGVAWSANSAAKSVAAPACAL